MDGEYDEKNEALLISFSIENIIIYEEIINSSILCRLDNLHYFLLNFHHLNHLKELALILQESHIWDILTIPSEDYNHI